MTTFTDDQERLAEQLARNQFEAENMHGVREVLRAYPQIRPNEANYNLITQYCAPFPANVEMIQSAFENNSNLIRELALYENVQSYREDLIERIVSYAKPDQRDFIRKNLSIQLDLKFLGTKPLHSNQTLERKLENAQLRADLEKKSPSELKAIVKAQHPRYTLPPVPATLTYDAFRRMSSQQQRHAVNFYGPDALNIAWGIKK